MFNVWYVQRDLRNLFNYLSQHLYFVPNKEKNIFFADFFSPQLTQFFSNVNVGAYAIACNLDILVNLEPTILANYPKLDLFYKTLYATSAFDGLRDFDNHFLRP